jgi:hypothetical protein
VSWIYLGHLCGSQSRIGRSVGAMHVLLWIRRFEGTWNVYFADFLLQFVNACGRVQVAWHMF